MQVLRFLTYWSCIATVGLAWTLALAWAVGRVLTDRYAWSQYLWWMPTPAVMPAIVGLNAFAWALLRASRTVGSSQTQRTDRPWLRRAIRLGWLWVLFMLGSFALIEVRVHRAIVGSRVRADVTPLRLGVWNVSVTRLADMDQRVLAMRPDVMLLANPPYFTPLAQTREAMGTNTSVVASGRLALLSRYPVLHHAWIKLDITGARPKHLRWAEGSVVLVDRGEALIVLLDTKEWNGADTCIWFIDLPSDVLIPRERMLREASEKLTSFRGDVLTRLENGLDSSQRAGESLLARLRQPDIIAGDMNTPRGSRSLRWLGEDIRHAGDDAGWGWRRTWPRSGPMWAIDHVLLGPCVRAVAYDTHDAGGHQHLAQVVEIVPAAQGQ